MINKLPQGWVTKQANSLRNKYLDKMRYDNFLDVWLDWWQDGYRDAVEFFITLGATESEIQAYLFSKGIDTYENQLMTAYLIDSWQLTEG